MTRQQFLAALAGDAWAIMPEKIAYLRAIGERDGQEPPIEALAGSGVQMAGRVAILPIAGVLMQRVERWMEYYGITSVERLSATFDSLLADAGVKAIVLAIDSPGGSVRGIPEFAAKIYAGRSTKKIVAVADGLAASAAYWLGSQATTFHAAPSALVGWIGALFVHTEFSKAEEQAGIKTTLIASEPFKAEGDPSIPLSEEAQAHLQEMVDEFGSMFVRDVARGRGVAPAAVKADFGQGRGLLAKDAKTAGMIDGIASVQQIIVKLGGGSPAAGPTALSPEQAQRLRYDAVARCAEIALD